MGVISDPVVIVGCEMTIVVNYLTTSSTKRPIIIVKGSLLGVVISLHLRRRSTGELDVMITL
jgi:hypothetical protein|tara:strand:- start:160 stop:345 length:186 start_codon:yes stop_codon:yes gene_type:complete